MSIYKPTYLYIKKHNVTGLKYFGKTKQDPYKYNGSGVYWTSHLKKHGYSVETIWCKLFNDEKELIDFAINFSNKNKIVESSDWANLMLENGSTGGLTEITLRGRKRISESKKGKSRPQSVIDALSKPKTSSHKENISRSTSKTWKIIDKLNGNIIITANLKSWCFENKINYQMILRFATLHKQYKNFLITKIS
jgi:hypothetical protein